MRLPRSSKSSLFSQLRDFASCLLNEASGDGPSALEYFEILNSKRVTRRHFLKQAGLSAALLAGSVTLPACASRKFTHPRKNGGPRIAIVGAGIAGLNACYQLHKNNISALIYEASKRPGGRMFSAKNIMGAGLVTELGGEFIDTNHQDMLQLISDFGLTLIDTKIYSEKKYRDGFFFGKQHYSEKQILNAFRPIAARIRADYDTLEDEVDYLHEGGARELDNLSITEYLERCHAKGFIKDLLEVAYVTEYGLDAEEQSALNLIFMIGTDMSKELALFGDSDERYKVAGGNQVVTDALAHFLEPQIQYEQTLLSVKSQGSGYRLSFSDSNSAIHDVDCDIAIITLPFSVLRNVELDVYLPPFKKQAIQQLGYGANAKVLVGFQERYWRSLGYSGAFFSDEEFQLCWDNSRTQDGSVGGITLYSGGKRGVEVGKGSAQFQADRLFTGVEAAMPGISKHLSGKVERFHWPSFKYSLGSYAAFKPGQWTTIAGAEGVPVGNLFFAGEHCSYDFQGFMNGGAETGRKAAELVLDRLNAPQVMATIPTNLAA